MAGELLVVDGPSMLYRAFYALPKTIKAPDGQPVNALLGTANLILREVAEHRPRAVVLCLGAEAAHYRVELYPAYHADRGAPPPELAPQLAGAEGFFAAFGWTVAAHDSLEADDLLGSYATRETESGGRTLLMTGDRDLYQCATDQVTVLYVRTGRQGAELVTPEEVMRRYGVPPAQVPDFIALRGDPSDGIPGARGVGPKTAAEILRRHGSIEAATAEPDPASGPPPRSRGALHDLREELLVFKDLATLRDVEVALPPDRPIDVEGAARAARSLGMERLAGRLEGEE